MQSSEAEEQTKKLAHRLGITLVRKGERDLISNGEKLVICDEETSSRRCGGQGDILGGAIALFAYWAKLKEANKQEKTTQLGYTTEHLMNGALAASQLVRQASLETFQKWTWNRLSIVMQKNRNNKRQGNGKGHWRRPMRTKIGGAEQMKL